MSSYTFKIILSGDCKVGKSTFLEQYVNNKFIEKYDPTIGIAFGHKTTYIDGNEIKLQMWELCGDRRFENIINNYYSGSACVFVFIDLSNINGIQNSKKWIDNAKEYNIKNIYLIGNKSDKKIITNKMINELCQEYRIKYYEISSKNYYDIEKIMTNITYELYIDLIKNNDYFSDEHELKSYDDKTLLQKKNNNNLIKPKKNFWNLCNIL